MKGLEQIIKKDYFAFLSTTLVRRLELKYSFISRFCQVSSTIGDFLKELETLPPEGKKY